VHWTKVCEFIPFQSKHFFYNTIDFLRFAETESTAVLTMFVSQFKITIKEEPQFAGETFEERKSRILSARQGLTLSYVLKQPLFFQVWIDKNKSFSYLGLFVLL
jgi:hypothetical protein